MEYNANEIMDCISDTTELIKEKQVTTLTTSFGAAKTTEQLVENVEFWRWMGQNYHCLDSAEGVKQIAERSPKWLKSNILQGKGHEWDFMRHQCRSFKNILSKFDAGIDPTQKGFDIKETNIFTGEVKNLFQNKAYTHKISKAKLSTTTKDMVVVTNAERVPEVQQMGYKTIPFQNEKEIEKATSARMKQALDGKAVGTYTLSNVGMTMAKSGAIGAVIGIGTETIASYRKWKNGEITSEQYLTEIAKSGGQYGIGSAATAGIMIPVTAAITTAQIFAPITIPIAILVGAGIDKIIAPAFGRGDYAKILAEAKYYQNVTTMYDDLAVQINSSAAHFDNFIEQIYQQDQSFQNMRSVNAQLNEQHKEANKQLMDFSDMEKILNKI